MASGPLFGGNGDGSRDRHRWAESKVYTRKSHNKSSKPSTDHASQSLPTTIVASADDATSSQHPISLLDAASDDSSSLNRPHNPQPSNGFLSNRIKLDLTTRSKQEIRDLRRKLNSELDQVRSLVRTLEARESQLNGAYGLTHQSNDDPKREKPSEVASAGPLVPHHQLSVSVVENNNTELAEKEKRTPKANQYYRNSEFLLGKDRLPTSDGSKKMRPNGTGNPVHDRLAAQAFKQCMSVLMRLIKHKHGWVFDKPVDVKGLGLHDYYSIIKHPMDLGTVKTRLESNWYKSPKEFAEDVRLTFRNAMTYNPKGQDVHIMAEQLLRLFEERWTIIDGEFCTPSRCEVDHEVGLASYSKKSQPQMVAHETRPNLDRSESTTTPIEPKPTGAVHYTASGRVAAPKKPKAKDPHKRDMTYEEKQKLSSNLMDLPPDKLDNIVQIIKKRNSALSQHDDEIEVDIDSFDAETLWELDRFVTNYKKSLSKNKRKAELAIQSRGEADNNNVRAMSSATAVTDVPKENKQERHNMYMTPVPTQKQGDTASRSSSSSSSSSDSGSSSSDSDSESSSGGSDAGQSPS